MSKVIVNEESCSASSKMACINKRKKTNKKNNPVIYGLPSPENNQCTNKATNITVRETYRYLIITSFSNSLSFDFMKVHM